MEKKTQFNIMEMVMFVKFGCEWILWFLLEQKNLIKLSTQRLLRNSLEFTYFSFICLKCEPTSSLKIWHLFYDRPHPQSKSGLIFCSAQKNWKRDKKHIEFLIFCFQNSILSWGFLCAVFKHLICLFLNRIWSICSSSFFFFPFDCEWVLKLWEIIFWWFNRWIVKTYRYELRRLYWGLVSLWRIFHPARRELDITTLCKTINLPRILKKKFFFNSLPNKFQKLSVFMKNYQHFNRLPVDIFYWFHDYTLCCHTKFMRKVFSLSISNSLLIYVFQIVQCLIKKTLKNAHEKISCCLLKNKNRKSILVNWVISCWTSFF